jgi:hypothetical protein
MSSIERRLKEKQRDGYSLYKLLIQGKGGGGIQSNRELQSFFLNTVRETASINHGLSGTLHARGEVLSAVYAVRGKGWETQKGVLRELKGCSGLGKRIKKIHCAALDLEDRDSWESVVQGPHEVKYAERPYENKHHSEWLACGVFGQRSIWQRNKRNLSIWRDGDEPYKLRQGGVVIYESYFLYSCFRVAGEIL